MPLFLVHGADGGVDYVRVVAGYVAANQPVWGVRMEGYASRPPPHRTIEDLARLYVAELKSSRPVGPYALGGYSIGGTLAFEMVRQLEAEGQIVSLLVLIDARFPPDDRDPKAMEGYRSVAVLTRTGRGLVGRLWRRHVSARAKRAITWSCVRFGWPLPRWWKIRTRFFWRMLATARDNYRPGRIRAPMLILAADGTTAAHASTWGPRSETGYSVIELAGGHLQLVNEPLVRELSFHLQRELASSRNITPSTTSRQ